MLYSTDTRHKNTKKESIIKQIGMTTDQELTPQLLEKLVRGAQNNIRHDIDTLCEYFTPLVYKESRREAVYRVLGEDAVNIAWEIFLRFIFRYNGADFIHLPGLIRYRLHYDLLTQMQKQGEISENETHDTEKLNSLQEETDNIERLTLSLALRQACSSLTPLQQSILQQLYVNELPVKQVSKLYRCSKANTTQLRSRCLKLLKQQLG